MTKLNARQSAFLLVVGGLAAGFLNGLLGAGGGILAVLVLTAILPTASRDSAPPLADKRDVFANALASMLPVAAVSAAQYAARDAIRVESALTYVLPAIAGGLAGALLLDRLPITAVRRLFTIITIFSGIVMLLRD